LVFIFSMEKTKKSSRKAGSKLSGTKIQDAYVEYVLTHGRRPASVYKFCLDLGIAEDEFYDHVGSFDGLESHIWKGFMETTIDRLMGDKEFKAFTTREKILAFYFTLLETLKHHRSYVLFQFEDSKKPALVPTYIKAFKARFESFVESVLAEGKNVGEVANRPVIDKRYPQLFWLHMGFILYFWKDDSSAGFEKTDAAIEKSVNLAFDLLGKGPVDSTIDFLKFLFQNTVH